jgi:hypothetical protein
MVGDRPLRMSMFLGRLVGASLCLSVLPLVAVLLKVNANSEADGVGFVFLEEPMSRLSPQSSLCTLLRVDVMVVPRFVPRFVPTGRYSWSQRS